MKAINIVAMVLLVMASHAQKQQSTYLGKTDFQALLTAVPKMPGNCQEAFGYVYYEELNRHSDKLEQRFASFNSQMEDAQKQMEQAFSAKYNAMMNDKGSDRLQRDVKKQVNQNPVIANMGGVDAVQGMSEAQRKKAAKNAMAATAASNGMGMFTEAEMTRMMNDPAYAKQMAEKLNNMTDQQKMAFVQSRMNTEPVTPEEAEEDNIEFEKQLKDRQKTYNLMRFNTYSAEATQKLSALLQTYQTEKDRISNKKGSHKELAAQFEEDYKKIPIVVVGEGRDHDPIKVQELRIAYASKHLDRAQQELNELVVSYNDMVAGIHQTIAEYDNFLDENKWAINATYQNTLNGTNPEFALIQVEQAIGASISEVGRICYETTAMAAHYQYDLKYKQSE